MDIIGPLPEAPRKIKYLIVAVDYFTKWIEAKAVTSITGKQAKGLRIKLVSTSVYHPQANGAVERANRSIMQGIKTRLHQEGGAWVEELPNVLWAHKTTPKTSNEETPFRLAYGTEAVIPAEIGIPTRRTIQGSDKENEEALKMNLSLLEERREIAAIREARRKQQVEKYYNQRVHHK
ncbi:reverse transcriptase domain-containing protein [Tanacetum coccineum]